MEVGGGFKREESFKTKYSEVFEESEAKRIN